MKSIGNLRFCRGYGEIINFGEFETTIKFEGRTLTDSEFNIDSTMILYIK